MLAKNYYPPPCFSQRFLHLTTVTLFLPQDICNMDKDIGLCVGRFKKWYYDSNRKECKVFTFGGCEGNGNRFSSENECQSVCVLQEEPALRYYFILTEASAFVTYYGACFITVKRSRRDPWPENDVREVGMVGGWGCSTAKQSRVFCAPTNTNLSNVVQKRPFNSYKAGGYRYRTKLDFISI